MRIKKIDVGEDTNKIACPICGKQLINSEGCNDQCKHVLLWSGTMAMDDDRPLFAKTKKIADCYSFLYKQHQENNSGEISRNLIQMIYGKNPDVKILCFDEGYMGGGQFAVSWIAFA